MGITVQIQYLYWLGMLRYQELICDVVLSMKVLTSSVAVKEDGLLVILSFDQMGPSLNRIPGSGYCRVVVVLE